MENAAQRKSTKETITDGLQGKVHKADLIFVKLFIYSYYSKLTHDIEKRDTLNPFLFNFSNFISIITLLCLNRSDFQKINHPKLIVLL